MSVSSNKKNTVLKNTVFQDKHDNLANKQNALTTLCKSYRMD